MGTVFVVLLVLAIVIGLATVGKSKQQPAQRKKTEFCLLKKRTPKGGIVVMVNDIAGLLNSNGELNGEAVDGLMVAVMKQQGSELPLDWVAGLALEAIDKIDYSVCQVPGSYEIWLDPSDPSKFR